MSLFFLFSAAFTGCDVNALKERTISYQKGSITYLTKGNAKKTIVFIHGWTGNANNWKYQIDSFPNYKVIAIDLPGKGKSSKNENQEYTMSFFADSIYAVLIKEKIDDCFLIGHSMGLGICEVFAQKYSRMCKGICSMDGSHFMLPATEKEYHDWIEYNRSFAKTMDDESGRDSFLSMLFLPNTPQLLKDEIIADSKEIPLIIAKAMISGVETDLKFWYPRVIDVPFLAIYSPVYQLPVDYDKELQKTFPKIEYHYIPDVSHYLMLEQPYRINQIITDFLRRNY